MGFDFAALRGAFFDSAGVLAAVSKARRKVLSKCGAFVRRRARSSIRKRKKSAPPGAPPSSHSGELKRLLFFAYDFATQSVVVGPVPFAGSKAGGDRRAPELLERGGPVTRRTKSGAATVHRYRGNPFMKPALDAELPKFVSQFKNLI